MRLTHFDRPLPKGLDGAAVEDLDSHREPSPVHFTLTAVKGSGAFPAGTYTDANSDGYWLMLAPLEPGLHTLHFGGTSLDYTGPDPVISVPSFTVDVTARAAVPIPLPPAALVGAPMLNAVAAARAWKRRRWRPRQSRSAWIEALGSGDDKA